MHDIYVCNYVYVTCVYVVYAIYLGALQNGGMGDMYTV